jgi:hypothetical protein
MANKIIIEEKDLMQTEDRQEKLKFVWMEKYKLLYNYTKEHGTCVIINIENQNLKSLRLWINKQRKDKDLLSSEQKLKLNEIGFIWDENEYYFELNYELLKQYYLINGNCNVSKRDNEKLYLWVKLIKSNSYYRNLSENQIEKLNELGIFENVSELIQAKTAYHSGFQRLVDYKMQYGDCDVKHNYHDTKLKRWIVLQRKNQNEMTPEKKLKLDEIGFIWDEDKYHFNQNYEQLKQYFLKNGNCSVSKEDNEKLFMWINSVKSIKTNRYNRSLSDNQIEKLNKLGFEWEPEDSSWEEGFNCLKAYKLQNGDCDVKHDCSDSLLRKWVVLQRKKRYIISKSKRRRLDEIGFIWNENEYNFDNNYDLLKQYYLKNGNCYISIEENKNLFEWTNSIRLAHNNKIFWNLTENQLDKLNEIKFDWDPSNTLWSEYYKRLIIYKMQFGDCDVKQDYSDTNLAKWVIYQRKIKDTIAPSKKQKLDNINFIWDEFDYDFNKYYYMLKLYYSKNGNCIVTKNDNENLYLWINLIRKDQNKQSNKRLSKVHIEKLNELGFDWEPEDISWEDGFNRLSAYKIQTGETDVKNDYSDSELLNWIYKQRNDKILMSSDKKKKLDEIGFIWDDKENKKKNKNYKYINDEDFEENFDLLKQHILNNGNCNVSPIDNMALYSWISLIRSSKKNNNNWRLTENQINKLNQIGFLWDRYENVWEKYFNLLIEYKVVFGSCHVKSTKKNRYLYKWVLKQKKNKNTMSSEKIRKLNEIGFQWKIKSKDSFDENYKLLQQYYEKNGNCKIPRHENQKLFSWMYILRVKKKNKLNSKLSEIQIKKLDELGFVWDPTGNSQMDGFKSIVEYKNQYGDCNVKSNFNNPNLRRWVVKQRKNKDIMPAEKKLQLDEIGFNWVNERTRSKNKNRNVIDNNNEYDDYFERNFDLIKQHIEKNGYSTISPSENKTLNSWVNAIRYYKRHNLYLQITEKQIDRLDEIGFDWEPLVTVWDKSFKLLIEFKEKYGNCKIIYNRENMNLYKWAYKQRIKKDKLSLEHIKKLDEIGFIWDQKLNNNKLNENSKENLYKYFNEMDFEQYFEMLKQYILTKRHSIVPAKENKLLSSWTSALRYVKKRKANKYLSENQIERLENIGFEWEPIKNSWNIYFNCLVEYKEEHGNCNILYSKQNTNLYNWILYQRTNKENLTLEQRQKLDDIGFSWKVQGRIQNNGFNSNYELLKQYYEKNGHCRIPRKENATLYNWINTIRISKRNKNKCSLTESQIEQLNEIGFDWEPNETIWEAGFEILSAFKLKYGHCKVTKKQSRLKLWRWIKKQRKDKEILSASKKQKLDDIGFIW